MEVFKPGSPVVLGMIHAIVNQVQIIGPNLDIRYEVVWWNGNERKECWVAAHEVLWDKESESIEIGFHVSCKSAG